MEQSETKFKKCRACSTNFVENLIVFAAIAPSGAERNGVQKCRACSANFVENLIVFAAIAQLVEQGTENPYVLGSIPSCGIFFN